MIIASLLFVLDPGFVLSWKRSSAAGALVRRPATRSSRDPGLFLLTPPRPQGGCVV